MELYDPAQFEPTGRTVTARGRACAELVREVHAMSARLVLLVDPARGLVPVRLAQTTRDRPVYQLDVTAYAADPVAGWVPAAWEYTHFDRTGQVFKTGRCKVDHYELNPAFGAGELETVAPPGTRVTDLTGTREVEHVVQPDGRPGKPAPRSEGRAYAELAAAGPADGPGAWRWPWAAAAGVFAGSAGLLGWRAVARARRSAPVRGSA
jgi:hypothetical protein